MTTENTRKLISARQVWLSKKIYWVSSYKTLLKYISSEYTNIFKPVVKGTKSGKRYFVFEDSVDSFVEQFEQGKLK